MSSNSAAGGSGGGRRDELYKAFGSLGSFTSVSSALPSNSSSSAAAPAPPPAMAAAKRSGRLANRPGYAEEKAAIQAAFDAKNAAATARKQELFQAAKDALDAWYASSEDSASRTAELLGIEYESYHSASKDRLLSDLKNSKLRPNLQRNIIKLFDAIEANTQARLNAAKSMGLVAPPPEAGAGGGNNSAAGGGGATASTAFDLSNLFAALEDDVEMAGGRRRGHGRSSRKSRKSKKSKKVKKSKKSKKSRRTHRK